ncbi:hypothetical protein EAH81_02945 [Flavobacterium pectinovorum]|uniref:Uncharacterized protein n=1 Tax=Flavobacterium pectinovorum TaxID=29533 RepID=A0A502F2Q4_9FLAO|nr:hypothetical protein EAH81_02945 [Flavobacterium pectinovorum]
MINGFFVISSEGRNHTRNAANKIANLCRVTSVISPFARNDKLCINPLRTSYFAVKLKTKKNHPRRVILMVNVVFWFR